MSAVHGPGHPGGPAKHLRGPITRGGVRMGRGRVVVGGGGEKADQGVGING